ncbi:MAG: hypothetical protein ACFFAN_14905 [Promethearchaeota archaeon]
MKQRKIFCIFMLSFVLSSIIFSFWLISINDRQNINFKRDDSKKENLNTEIKPRTANKKKAITPGNISQNDTIIYRSFDSVNFTVNVTGFEAVSYAIMQISFTNNTVKNYTMTFIDGSYADNYTYTYTPEYKAPLGDQKVNFLLYNASDFLLNTNETSKYFTVKSNCGVVFNPASEYSRGGLVIAEIYVSEIDGFNFNWKITIVNNTRESIQKNLFDIGNDGDNLGDITFKINASFDQSGIYYVKVNMTKQGGDGITRAAYFEFNVLNELPSITSVNFNPSSVYREESCEISIAVSDFETNTEDIKVFMKLLDPDGEQAYSATVSYNGGFKKSFTIDADELAGKYRVEITAIDESNGQDTYITYLTVKNNPPEINSYEINDYSQDESISVLYGEDLVFTFDVEDIEGIALIKVALLNEDDDWYNYTREVDEDEEDIEDVEIIIRTTDLISGSWEVYVYVTDTDDKRVGLDSEYEDAPQEITIVPDLLSGIFPWIMLIIGLVIGIIISGGLVYHIVKSKKVESKIMEQKKPLPKKPTKKKKYIPPKPTPPEKKRVKKEIKEEISDEKEPKKVPSKRKIKRKLK